MGRNTIGALALGTLACVACGSGVPYAASGPARDAGPPTDANLPSSWGAPPPGGAQVGSSASASSQSSTSDAGQASSTECVVDGDYRVLTWACDGTLVARMGETWTFSDHGHTVSAGGAPASVDCVVLDASHTQLTIVGSVGGASSARSTWTAFRDSATCLILSSPQTTCEGQQATALIDFDGPL